MPLAHDIERVDRHHADAEGDRDPDELGIARAFALSQKLLLLDEPFGMLDSLTRWELQERLMEVWSRTKVTAICVTHDVDEAILLANRVVEEMFGYRAGLDLESKPPLLSTGTEEGDTR